MLRQCGRCGKWITSGSKCDCLKQRHKEYNQSRTDAKEVSFYGSKEWKKLRLKAIAYYNGLDIYSYYIDGTITYGYTLHHIIPVKDDWSKRLELNNTIYLTEANHKKIHEEINKGIAHKKAVIKLLQELVAKYNAEFYEHRGY